MTTKTLSAEAGPTDGAYTAVYDRDEQGMWLVELLEEPRVHTYGRTLAKARANMHDAAALWFDTDPGELRLVDDVRLPAPVLASAARANQARRDAAAAKDAAMRATAEAAVTLVHGGHLSVRDAAEVLGLSHQRVQQLVLAAAATDVAS